MLFFNFQIFYINSLNLLISLFNICTWVHYLRPNTHCLNLTSLSCYPVSACVLWLCISFSGTLHTELLTLEYTHVNLSSPSPFTSSQMLSESQCLFSNLGSRLYLLFLSQQPFFQLELLLPLLQTVVINFMDHLIPPESYLLSLNKLFVIMLIYSYNFDIH